MQQKIREISQVGIFSALAFAGGHLFIAVPNVEIVTSIIFLAGVLLGSKNGMLVGFIAQTLFSTINPYGISPPPLFVTQVINRILLGYVGGQFRQFAITEKNTKKIGISFGIAGFLMTLLFDVSTDASTFFISGFSLEQMRLTFILGAGWYVIHGIGNTLIFAIGLPLVLKSVLRLELFKAGSTD